SVTDLTAAANTSSGNLITGNVVSGSGGDGIHVNTVRDAQPGTTISNNLIGTDAAGGASLENGFGMHVSSGDAGITGNVISGNHVDGVLLEDSALVQGNRIGVGADGHTAVANRGAGVTINSSGNLIGGYAP